MYLFVNSVTRLPLSAGIVSLVSLSLLSFERYCVVLRSTRPDSSQYLRAWLAVAASWLYSLFWTLPPLLGWSRSVQFPNINHQFSLELLYSFIQPHRKVRAYFLCSWAVMAQRVLEPSAQSSGTSVLLQLAPTSAVCLSSACSCRCCSCLSATGGSCWQYEGWQDRWAWGSTFHR